MRDGGVHPPSSKIRFDIGIEAYRGRDDRGNSTFLRSLETMVLVPAAATAGPDADAVPATASTVAVWTPRLRPSAGSFDTSRVSDTPVQTTPQKGGGRGGRGGGTPAMVVPPPYSGAAGPLAATIGGSVRTVTATSAPAGAPRSSNEPSPENTSAVCASMPRSGAPPTSPTTAPTARRGPAARATRAPRRRRPG